MAEKSSYVCVGAVAGAFGVRGEVRLKAFTAAPEDLFDYSPFTDQSGRTVLTVASWRHIKDGFAAYCDEVASREEADALKSLRLYAARERLPELDDDEFYHADLIGMPVVDLAGEPLGEVRAVHDFGSGDLLEIWRTPSVKGGWYLPFTREQVPHVDLKAGVITADPAPGFLPTPERASGAGEPSAEDPA